MRGFFVVVALAATAGPTALRSAPARLNSYSGAAQAAERAGKKEDAKVFRERLVALCGGSLPVRAKAAVTTKGERAGVSPK